MKANGFAEDAVCPTCKTYTTQQITARGVRRCLGCRTEFKLKDTQTLRKVQRATKARRQREKLTSDLFVLCGARQKGR